MMCFSDRRYVNVPKSKIAFKFVVQCDTFSSSSDAVFELSMRSAEPHFKLPEIANKQLDRVETNRLLFMELSQGKPEMLSQSERSHSLRGVSLPLGQFDGFVIAHQYD